MQLSGRRSQLLSDPGHFYGVDRIQCGNLRCFSRLQPRVYANYPLLRAQRSLSKEGAQLTGFEAVDTFSTINGVTVDASELFPSDNVLLHNIKMFEKRRIDEAILDASSALCSFDGTIKNIFMKIIQGKMEILKRLRTWCMKMEWGCPPG